MFTPALNYYKDSVNLWASLQACCTRVTDKENLMTRFSVNRQNQFKGLLMFIHVAMATGHASAKLPGKRV